MSDHQAQKPACSGVGLPYLVTGCEEVNKAFRMALGDLLGNVLPFRGGLLAEPRRVIIAGLDYVTPWTRDAAINSWFCGSLLLPDVARDTLLAVIERDPSGRLVIGGEYWDAMIWATGAWNHYLVSGDREFLTTALEATRNTLTKFEEEEFDPAVGMFRGGACFQDGIAGYPDYYAAPGCGSGIADWPTRNPQTRPAKGHGLPMFALSTNCLYYNAYRLAGCMARELSVVPDDGWERKAVALRTAINEKLWDANTGSYHYMLGPHGDCSSQEGLGSAFALLFGVADAQQAAAVLGSQHIEPAGIPCVWPGFERFAPWGGNARHSGIVWTHVQGFWALAALKWNAPEKFRHELRMLTKHANRDAQFAEIYHARTGEMDGGWQERGSDGIVHWDSCRRQTWSATAYLALLLRGVCGLQFTPEGLRIAPSLPEDLGCVRLEGIFIMGTEIRLTLQGHGRRIRAVRMNGQSLDQALISHEELRGGMREITIELRD